MGRIMNHRKSLNILIAIITITLIVVCGCSKSDEPLKYTAVMTSQNRDLTTLKITNNNWYDWTDVEIEAYSTQFAISDYYHMKFYCSSPNLIESGKTFTVNINTRKVFFSSEVWDRWDGKLGLVTIQVFTVKGLKYAKLVY